MQPKTKKTVRVKALHGTPYLISQDQFIGKGSFATVVKAYNKDNKTQQLAAKIIPLRIQGMIESIKSQVQLLKQLPYHPNLVNCKKIQISSQNNFYLIMEYCNQGSFRKYLSENKHISQDKIWKFIRQFCRGYRVLYENSIIHRDIKPQNILIHNGVFKIADFGLARKIDKDLISQKLSWKGTPLYMAPQLSFNQQGSSKVDVFSFGIVLYQLAFQGQYPFGSNFHSKQQYFQHFASASVKIPQISSRSQKLKKLIYQMLDKNPQKRISWQQIFQHPKISIHQSKSHQIIQDNQQNLQVPNQLISPPSMLYMKKSVAQVQQFPQKFYFKDQIENQVNQLIEFIELICNQNEKIRKILFKGKLIVTTIKHVNKHIQQLPIQNFYLHIKKQLQLTIKLGYKFCWEIFNIIIQKISIKNKNNLNQSLQDQKKIISQKLIKLGQQPNSITSIFAKDQYPSHLSNFLSQYPNYPQNDRNILRIIISFLIDIFDSSLKFIQQQYQLADCTQLDTIKIQSVNKIKQYLDHKVQITDKDIQNQLKLVGLLIE